MELGLGVEYSWNKQITSELKIVIVGHDSSKGETSLLHAKVTPVGFAFKSGELEIPLADGGYAQFTGKVYLTFEVAPNWAQIAPDLAARLGPGAFPATVSVGGALITGGFILGGALVLYGYYRSAQDMEDLSDLRAAHQKAVIDFEAGFMTALGMPAGAGNTNSVAGKEGFRHGQIWARSMLAKYRAWQNNPTARENWRKTYSEMFKAEHGHYPSAKSIPERPELTDEEILERFKGGWGKSEFAQDHMRRCIHRAYDHAIKRQIYDAFVDAHPDLVETKGDVGEARTYAGLKDVGELPSPEPDYGELENIFALGSPPPAP